MGYRLVRILARSLLAVFYHRVEVVGLERLPQQGPLVLVANHHNAVIDPMLLLGTVPRRIVPVAKAPLFHHALMAPLLRLVGALPAHRRQDARGDPNALDPARNAELFARATATLRADRVILIFPEGVSQPEPALMPLRTGTARIVLGTASGGTLGVTILPVGLIYHDPATLRTGRALVIIGTPVPTADLVGADGLASETAVRTLTERIAAALRALIVEARDRQTLHLLRLADAIWRTESSEQRDDAASQTARMRRMLRGQAYLAAREPGRADRFRHELEHYARDLEGAGLAGHALARSYPAGVVIRYAVREGTSLALGLPLALWGIAQHLIAYQLTSLIVRALRPVPDSEATHKIAAAVRLYPLCWAGEAWVARRLGGGWLLAALLAGLLPGGFFALAWQERLERVTRDARGFLHFLVHRDLHRRLVDRGRALRKELDSLAELVPESVLSGALSR